MGSTTRSGTQRYTLQSNDEQPDPQPVGIKTLHYADDVTDYTGQILPRNIHQISQRSDSTTALHSWETHPSNREGDIPRGILRREAHLVHADRRSSH
ncbi:hypothetical protein OUZ56_005568 [Daphnia magna]|uniref:Uncharacterized protein n=1 Tax=Daphnia magna TaxID=35525 RepID=A0ABQ9YT56_9CRUS|nr:hypothetical protein OUZ56_005568 [Daphnia magna]